MTQDLFYYESGYVDNSYFVYTADAESSAIFEASISCDATVLAGGVIVDGTSSWLSAANITTNANKISGLSADLNCEFTQSAVISHIHGADLFAMGNAAMAIEVSVIRDNNISVSGAYTVTANAERTRWISGSLDSTVNSTITNSRVRYDQADMSSAFSMSAIATRSIKLASTINANFSMTISNSRIRNLNATINSNFVSAQSAIKIISIVSNLLSSFTELVAINKASEYWISSSGNQIQDIAFDSAGNIFGVGEEGTVFKRGKYGNILSQFAFNSNSVIRRIVVDASDNIYVLGFSYVNGFNGSFVAKINSTTNTILWQKSLNSLNNTGYVQFLNLEYDQSSDSIIIVGAWMVSSATPGLRESIIRINSSGTVLWSKFLIRGAGSIVSGISSKIRGSYIYVIGTPGTVARFDFNSGALSWVYGMSGSPQNIDVDSNGYVYICGDLGSTVSTSKLFLLKLNSSGVQQWNRTIDNISSYDYEYGMSIYNDEIFISGVTGSSEYNNLIAKFDTSGNLIFQRLISTSNNDYGVSINAKNQIMYIDGNYSAQLPIDGSLTGTHGIFNYAESSATVSTDVTFSLYSDTINFTNNAGGPSITTSSYSIIDSTKPVSYAPTFILAVSGAASMASSSLMQVTATRNIGPIVANIFSTSTISISATKIHPGNCDVVMDGIVLVAASRIRPFIDIEVVSITMVANISKSILNSAQLSISSNVSCNVTKIMGPVVIAGTSTAQLSASANKTSGNTINMQVDGFLLAAGGRIRPFVDTDIVISTMVIDAFVGKIANATFTSNIGMVVSAVRNIGAIIIQSDITTQLTAAADLITGNAVTMGVTSSTIGNANRLRSTPVSSAVTTVQTTAGKVTRTLNSSITSAITLVESTTRIKQLSAAFISSGAELIAINKVGNTLIHKQVTSTMVANAIVLTASSVYMEINVTDNVIAQVNKTYSSHLSITTDLLAAGETGIIGEMYVGSISSMVANANVINKLSANMVSQFITTIDTGAIRDNIALEISFADMLVDGDAVRGIASNISTLSTLVINGGLIKNVQADMHCDGFVMGEGKVINLEASAIYRVPVDYNTWVISGETNLYSVKYEQRTYKIKE